MDQARHNVARAARAVAGARQEQLQIQLLELELETALHVPARLDVPLEVAIEQRGEPCSLGARLLRIARVGAHEQAVGVAVQHTEASRLEPLLRPEQQMLAHAGDRVGERGIEEAACRGAEHTIERVHQDLDGVRGHVVAAALRRLAPREQLVEESRQDRGLAVERAVGCTDQIEIRRGHGHVAHGIDVESANDAGVEALEIEHPDVASADPLRTRARGRLVARRARASRRPARSVRRCARARARRDTGSRTRRCWRRPDRASCP